MRARLHPPALVLRDRTLEFSRRTYVMGVLNVTPDSFSDGARFLDPGAALAHAEALVAEGADLIDVGGESTRPPGTGAAGYRPVDADEELCRVLPVLRRLRAHLDVPLSIDTTKAAVARAAVDAGADLVNDVSGLRYDPELARAVAALRVPVVLVHSRGEPGALHVAPRYGDVVSEVAAELGTAAAHALRAGIPPERVILDPGIGFSKSAEHNLPLLADLGPVCALGRPVLVGVSRKSFLGRLTGKDVAERAAATAAATVAAILAGADLVRVHEVAPLRDAIRVADGIRRRQLPH